jgi:hypothetical protein
VTASKASIRFGVNTNENAASLSYWGSGKICSFSVKIAKSGQSGLLAFADLRPPGLCRPAARLSHPRSQVPRHRQPRSLHQNSPGPSRQNPPHPNADRMGRGNKPHHPATPPTPIGLEISHHVHHRPVHRQNFQATVAIAPVEAMNLDGKKARICTPKSKACPFKDDKAVVLEGIGGSTSIDIWVRFPVTVPKSSPLRQL